MVAAFARYNMNDFKEAEWLRHWTLNHEIVGSRDRGFESLHTLSVRTWSLWARFVPAMFSGSLSRK